MIAVRGRVIRSLRDFLLRTGVILAICWAGAQASDSGKLPSPTLLSSKDLRGEASSLLGRRESLLESDDVRYLPALIDLLESPWGINAGRLLARILRRREITDEAGRPVVTEDRLSHPAYRRTLRAGLVNWFQRHGDGLQDLWPTISLERVRKDGL